MGLFYVSSVFALAKDQSKTIQAQQNNVIEQQDEGDDKQANSSDSVNQEEVVNQLAGKGDNLLVPERGIGKHNLIRIAYSAKERMGIYVYGEKVDKESWCQPKMNFFIQSSQPTYEKLTLIFHKLPDLLQTYCPKAEEIYWQFGGQPTVITFEGNSEKEKAWQLSLNSAYFVKELKKMEALLKQVGNQVVEMKNSLNIVE